MSETAPLLSPADAASAIAEHAAASMPAPNPAPAAPAAAEASAPRPPATAPAGTVLTDKSGKAFDASRHKSNADGSPFVNSKGYFMPIGGRKTEAEKAAAAAAAKPAALPSTASAKPAGAATAADPSAASAWSAEDRKAAATPGPTETAAAGYEGAAAAATAPAGDGRGEDAKLSPEQAGELTACLLYSATGAITGDDAAATATGAEHTNLVNVFTAFLRYRGYTVTGWGALGFSVLFFLVNAKRRASVMAKAREWFGGWFGSWFGPKAPRRVEPAPEQPGPATPARAEVVEESAAPSPTRQARADFVEV